MGHLLLPSWAGEGHPFLGAAPGSLLPKTFQDSSNHISYSTACGVLPLFSPFILGTADSLTEFNFLAHTCK